MPVSPSESLTACPASGEYCPFLAECVRGEIAALAGIEAAQGRSLDVTLRVAELDAERSEFREQLDEALTDENIGAPEADPKLGRAINRADRSRKKVERRVEKLDSALDRKIKASERLAEIHRQAAARTRQVCEGGPLIKKRFGALGRNVMKCAANQTLFYEIRQPGPAD